LIAKSSSVRSAFDVRACSVKLANDIEDRRLVLTSHRFVLGRLLDLFARTK